MRKSDDNTKLAFRWEKAVRNIKLKKNSIIWEALRNLSEKKNPKTLVNSTIE